MGKKSNRKRLGREMRERHSFTVDEDKRKGYIAIAFLFIGVSLFTWGGLLAQDTFIPGRILWLLALAGAVIAIAAFAWTWRHDRWQWGWYTALVLFYGTIAGAPIPFFTVTAINYYLKSEETTTVVPPILKKGTDMTGRRASRRCRYPYVIVTHNNISNRVNFPCDTEVLDEYKVELTISKGYLGYYVITDKRLTE